MSTTIASPPIQDSIVQMDDSKERRSPFFLAKAWVIWLQQSLIPRIQAAPQWLKTVSLTTQHAAIPATAIPMAVLATGRYRVSWYVRVTTVASVNSSVTVTIGWTEGSVALTLSGVALTGNTTSSVQVGSVVLQVDRATSLTYATAYVSNAAGMQYSLILEVENVS